jgi:hypothetical protein
MFSDVPHAGLMYALRSAGGLFPVLAGVLLGCSSIDLKVLCVAYARCTRVVQLFSSTSMGM